MPTVRPEVAAPLARFNQVPPEVHLQDGELVADQVRRVQVEDLRPNQG